MGGEHECMWNFTLGFPHTIDWLEDMIKTTDEDAGWHFLK